MYTHICIRAARAARATRAARARAPGSARVQGRSGAAERAASTNASPRRPQSFRRESSPNHRPGNRGIAIVKPLKSHFE